MSGGIMDKKQALRFAAIFLIGLAIYAAAVYAKAAQEQSLSNYEWNGEPCDISAVNSFDAKFARPYSKKLSVLGTLAAVFTMGAELCLVGAVSFFPAKDKVKAVKGLAFDAFVFVNCWIYGRGVYRLLKAIAGRVRPYMYFPNPKASALKNGDFCRSMPSGHCGRVFIVFGFLFCWFLFRNKDSKLRAPALCAAFLLSVFVMVLRVASGNHFVTDTLCGAAIGFLVSCAVFLVYEKAKKRG